MPAPFPIAGRTQAQLAPPRTRLDRFRWRVPSGSYPFRDHRTCAQWEVAD